MWVNQAEGINWLLLMKWEAVVGAPWVVGGRRSAPFCMLLYNGTDYTIVAWYLCYIPATEGRETSTHSLTTQHWQSPSLIARFMGPTWGPSGANRAQMGPMLAPWTSALTITLANTNFGTYFKLDMGPFWQHLDCINPSICKWWIIWHRSYLA